MYATFVVVISLQCTKGTMYSMQMHDLWLSCVAPRI